MGFHLEKLDFTGGALYTYWISDDVDLFVERMEES